MIYVHFNVRHYIHMSLLKKSTFCHSVIWTSTKYHRTLFLANVILLRIQGCQIFLCITYQNGKNIPNTHKICQITTEYTKWHQNTPNGRKIIQMSTVPPKLTQIIFLVWKRAICTDFYRVGGQGPVLKASPFFASSISLRKRRRYCVHHLCIIQENQ
jgi:hypothetical protein